MRVLKAGGKVVEDKGKIRHVDGDFFLHKGRLRYSPQGSFSPVPHAAPEQAADIVGSHILPSVPHTGGQSRPCGFLPLSFSKVQSRMVGSVKPRRFSSSTVSKCLRRFSAASPFLAGRLSGSRTLPGGGRGQR